MNAEAGRPGQAMTSDPQTSNKLFRLIRKLHLKKNPLLMEKLLSFEEELIDERKVLQSAFVSVRFNYFRSIIAERRS